MSHIFHSFSKTTYTDLTHPFTPLITAFNDKIVKNTKNLGGREIGNGRGFLAKIFKRDFSIWIWGEKLNKLKSRIVHKFLLSPLNEVKLKT